VSSTRRLSWVASAALAAAVLIGSPVRAQRTSPNIVLIVADDLGWGEVGAYGQRMIATPNLDGLAARGIRFTDAYAPAPVCAPSRCSILTGRYAAHCSATENARPNVPLSLETPNLALWLSARGYQTALVGKWGLGGELDEGTRFASFSLPNAIGFDHFAGLLDQQLAEVAYPYEWWRNDERIENEVDGHRQWMSAVLIGEALAYLDQRSNDAPFFLLFTPTLPHREYRVPAIDLGYRDRGWPEVEATYATMVSELDRQVGAILERLESTGLREDTWVVFTSDNGPSSSEGHDTAFFALGGALRGEKRDLYEGGLRVPLIVVGPHITAREEATPVALYDLMPTFAELAGAPASGVDGVSLVALFSGGPLEREALIFSGGEAARKTDDEDDTRFATRAGSLSLVERRSGASELYDLSSDPAQAHDLAASMPDDLARLRALRERLSGPRPVTPGPELTLEGAPLFPVLTPVVAFSFDRGDPLASAWPRPTARLSPVGGAALHEGRLRLPRGSDGAARAHAVLAAQPSYGFGRSSFTFSARVRLEDTSGAIERATVACARPAGREERFTDWALLARVGPTVELDAVELNAVEVGTVELNAVEVGTVEVGTVEVDTVEVGTVEVGTVEVDASEPVADSGLSEAVDPRRVAMLFGDPSVSGRGRRAAERAATLPIISRLMITDEEPHTLQVVYDAERAELRFTLDDETDVVPVPRRLHYPSDGPLVLGACLDVGGRAEGAMVGSLDDVVLARGAGTFTGEGGSVRLPEVMRSSVVVHVDASDARGEDVVEHVVVRNPLSEGSGRVLRLELDATALTDPRLSLESFEPLLLPGHERTLVLHVRTSPGVFADQAFEVVATDALLGTLASGTPLHVTIEGEISAPPSRVGWIEGGGLLLLLMIGGGLLLRRR